MFRTTKRSRLWALLNNDIRSIEVPSGDWEMIMMKHGSLSPHTDARWSPEEGTWLWTANEACALADVLKSEGGRACAGRLTVDLEVGGGIRGTGSEFVEDGLTPDQRTAKLIEFLREGSFRWKFVTAVG